MGYENKNIENDFIPSGGEEITSSPAASTDIGQIKRVVRGEMKIVKDDFKEEIRIAKDDFRDKIEERSNKNVEILAIFVSLFTFISIDFQIFKQVISTIAAIGISLVTLGSLCFFILILGHALGSRNMNRNILIFLTLAFILGGITLIGLGPEYKFK